LFDNDVIRMFPNLGEVVIHLQPQPEFGSAAERLR